MTVIYPPKGKALEYSPLACNLYRGCQHGCSYCYAPNVLYMKRETFNATAVPRKDIIKQVRREAPEYRGIDDYVLFCFTSDPYQPCEAEHRITRQAIEIFIENDVPFQILTKGGELARRDFDLLESVKTRCKFGTTLLFTNEQDRLKWEPGAATIQQRIDAIQDAHDRGIPTWVSIEPVIDPAQAIELIGQINYIVDFWKIGKLNYHPIAKEIDWKAFAEKAIETLESVHAKYYIKNDLRAYLKGAA